MVYIIYNRYSEGKEYMSLTRLISGEYKEFFKKVAPAKEEFKTVSGKTAFSKDYEENVKYKLNSTNDASIVGTAFDYLARWIVAKTINIGKSNSYQNLIAEQAVRQCELEAQIRNLDRIQEKYTKGINCCEQFVNGANNKKDLLMTAIFFAKLERIYRGKIPAPLINFENLFEIEKDIYDDLYELSELFQKKMIDSGIITSDSQVVFNPIFGEASKLCNGADADIFIDGTLYDFKCTKKYGYSWREAAQLLGYFFLHNIAESIKDSSNDLKDQKIKRIAFYRARFGEIEYYDVEKIDYHKEIEELSLMLESRKHTRYLENEEINEQEKHVIGQKKKKFDKSEACYEEIKKMVKSL